MDSLLPPRYVILGQLRRDYILPFSSRLRLDVPGGNTLYAAAGLSLWDSSIGLVARVGEDYPRTWLDDFADKGLNLRGVRVLPQALDLRSFFAYSEGGVMHTDNPVGHFAQRGLSFPRSLLDYQDARKREDSLSRLTPYSLRQSDLPPDYKHATTAHLGPVDYMTHSLMPAVLRQAGFATLTLDPGPSYMKSSYWKYIPAILAGLTAFIVAEEELRALFQGRSVDLWEMMSVLGAYGCGLIVVKRGDQGQLLLVVSTGERWEIPAYPARVVDPTGAGDAFCGGFLAGYEATYDPLQAVLYGNVSASIVIEGTGPFYALDVLPGLPQARLEVLQGAYRKVT
jgi:sugar/nucleoside kinase (ribokinase family)